MGCVLMFPIWLLGIPGVDNEYAKAWENGLILLVLLPLVSLPTLLLCLIPQLIKPIPEGVRRFLHRSGAILLLLAILIFIVGMVWVVRSFSP